MFVIRIKCSTERKNLRSRPHIWEEVSSSSRIDNEFHCSFFGVNYRLRIYIDDKRTGVGAKIVNGSADKTKNNHREEITATELPRTQLRLRKCHELSLYQINTAVAIGIFYLINSSMRKQDIFRGNEWHHKEMDDFHKRMDNLWSRHCYRVPGRRIS